MVHRQHPQCPNPVVYQIDDHTTTQYCPLTINPDDSNHVKQINDYPCEFCGTIPTLVRGGRKALLCRRKTQDMILEESSRK